MRQIVCALGIVEKNWPACCSKRLVQQLKDKSRLTDTAADGRKLAGLLEQDRHSRMYGRGRDTEGELGEKAVRVLAIMLTIGRSCNWTLSRRISGLS